MRLLSLVFLVLVPAAFAAPINGTDSDNDLCGSHVDLQKVRVIEEGFANYRNLTNEDAFRAPTFATISVVWNIIAESSGGAGDLSAQDVRNTISALNTHFAGSGISFRLTRWRKYLNPRWHFADKNTANQLDMKRKLHLGNAQMLNIYSVGFGGPDGANPNLLGHATFPWDLSASQPWRDGIVMKYTAVTGGSSTNYGEGKTLTHEVGHWLGLYHTFQGGCIGSSSTGGDYVTDTPAQADPTTGCPAERDSCPTRTGSDPIHNFMDYSHDRCRFEFTNGQLLRAKMITSRHRNIGSLID